MTREEFLNARFSRLDKIEWCEHVGRITMVDFDYGVIHHMDDKKGSHYGHHYSEVTYIPYKKEQTQS